MKLIHALLFTAFLALAGGTHLAMAESAYDTGRLTEVEVALANSDGQPALLSFYSQGTNGLRLLENAFSDTLGHYSGRLLLPIHLAEVVLVIRTEERQDTVTLQIDGRQISHIE